MGWFTRKSWLDKLKVNGSIRAQAKARYERLVAGNIPDAQHRVEAWAINEQRKLDHAKSIDAWS